MLAGQSLTVLLGRLQGSSIITQGVLLITLQCCKCIHLQTCFTLVFCKSILPCCLIQSDKTLFGFISVHTRNLSLLVCITSPRFRWCSRCFPKDARHAPGVSFFNWRRIFFIGVLILACELFFDWQVSENKFYFVLKSSL